MARPTKLTPEIIESIADGIRSGLFLDQACHLAGISPSTFYLWRKHYADMGVSEVHQLKEFGEENRRFKDLVTELTLDRQILQNVLSRKL